MRGLTARAMAVLARDDTSDKLLQLLQDPFDATVAENGVLAAVGTALGISTAIFALFLFMRPFNSTVYAPRLRHVDEKHKPPPLGKGIFAWVTPVMRHNESQYVHTIGMDATIFLRFGRMCRNIFIVLALLGCGIVLPVNIIKNKQNDKAKGQPFFMMTPQFLTGTIFWAFVVIAWVFDIVICGFLWWNYRAVHRLRRDYLESPEYQTSLHSRTLMVSDIPRSLRSDQGIVEVTDMLRTTPEVPRASIGRNVKHIPELIEEHEEAVIELEQVLAKYLKNPNKMPAQRPLCKPSKKDADFAKTGEKVDAIDYLTTRINHLEAQIKEAREGVDKRDAMPYGFASYETLESAHSVAYSARRKHPQGTTVQLAPKPNDIIWKNLPLDPKTRRWRRFINNVWIALLTALYFIPNALIAVFLSKLSNIGNLWPAFQVELQKDPKFWGVVQGLLAPALTSLFYYFLPIIFRRLSVNAGDLTKTSRERHVIHQLYAFFVFNNLFVFSLFAAAFSLITTIVNQVKKGEGTSAEVVSGELLSSAFTALCQVSPFWVTWLVQRNLGAAIDLAQVVNLAWGSFSRKFLNPTPREMIKRTAPPPFDYASYYNYFLFYSTVALCFAALQPITLVVTAIYFTFDASMKKYLLLYVFCTKIESGGQYWRVLFNRFLVATFISNLIIAFACAAGGSDKTGDHRWAMLAALVPLPFLLLGFKFYCKNAFDTSMKYYNKGTTPKGAEAPTPIDKESRRRDRVAVRFGHPALYQKLTVPMVHKKSQHLLAEVYKGRLDGDLGTSAGYSDVYSMKRMSKDNPGKAVAASGPFEFVSDHEMDFENFKNRPEFAAEHGGEGSIYGHIDRPGTPGSMMTMDRGRSASRERDDQPGVTYPAGYHTTPSNLREYSPSPDRTGFGRMESSPYTRDEAGLLGSAAPMGRQEPGRDFTPYSPERDGQQDYFKR